MCNLFLFFLSFFSFFFFLGGDGPPPPPPNDVSGEQAESILFWFVDFLLWIPQDLWSTTDTTRSCWADIASMEKIFKETMNGKTVVHLFDPEFIQQMHHSEARQPHREPLMETSKIFRRYSSLPPGLGNLWVSLQYRHPSLRHSVGTIRCVAKVGYLRCGTVYTVRFGTMWNPPLRHSTPSVWYSAEIFRFGTATPSVSVQCRNLSLRHSTPSVSVQCRNHPLRHGVEFLYCGTTSVPSVRHYIVRLRSCI